MRKADLRPLSHLRGHSNWSRMSSIWPLLGTLLVMDIVSSNSLTIYRENYGKKDKNSSQGVFKHTFLLYIITELQLFSTTELEQLATQKIERKKKNRIPQLTNSTFGPRPSKIL